MESFNFLKFWRTTAAVRDIDSDFDSVKKSAINDLHYVRNPTPESTDEDSFFDLVFTENNIPKPESPKLVLVKPTDANSKPHSPNSVLNTSPNFRVCFLGFRKSKPEKVDLIDHSSTTTPKIQTQKASPKAHETKIEEVPISCISFSSLKGTKLRKVDEADNSSKQFARADMTKYLRLMRPLFSKASKRFTQKTQLCSPSVQSLSSPRNSSDTVAVLAAVRKRLGKSRSIAGVSPSPMYRRDDSLLQAQNDGIQGAILHCKRSYSSARKDCSVLLSRNANEDLPRASCHEEQNRWSI